MKPKLAVAPLHHQTGIKAHSFSVPFTLCRIAPHQLDSLALRHHGINMHLKPMRRNSRPQQQYNRRSHTTPCFSNLMFPGRVPSKTIKSLNVMCLAQIFEFLEYKDLVSCQRVCSYWKYAVDYHLARRTHFAYGKAYRVMSQRAKAPPKKVSYQNNVVVNTSLMYSCEKCLLLNQKLQQFERISPSPSFTSDEENTFSPNLSLTPISVASPVGSNYSDFDYSSRCSDCQLMLQEFHKQLQDEIDNQEESNEDEDEAYYEGYIDYINMEVLEHILSKLPNLYEVKFAHGYQYGRLRQSCLDVTAVELIPRTHRLCPNLIRIDLSNCIGLLESDFSKLVELYGNQLTSLNLSGCRIEEKCLRIVVKGCHRLRYLNISNNFGCLQGCCFEWLADSIETIVADHSQNVRVLDGLLYGKGREIIELELNVGFCINPNMPYRLLGNHFHNLISLKITFKSFGPCKRATLVGLAQLTDLECLYLVEEIDDFGSESSLDDDSVLPIMQSCGPRLRELYLHAASSLFGGPSSLTDRSIVHVHVLCPLLEVFSIKRAAITDLSLESIAQLKNAYTVQLIDLENISQRGVKNIMCSFKEIESQELENIKKSTGVDVNVSDNGPKIEKMKRHGSFAPLVEAAVAH